MVKKSAVIYKKQVVLLKNAEKEIRLAVLSLHNGKAETISTAIEAVLAEYELHSCIRIIICLLCLLFCPFILI